MEPIGKLANIVITSSRFEPMLDFYGKTLGLNSFYHDKTSCFFKAGGVNVVIVRGNSKPGKKSEKVCLDFGVPDVAKAAIRLTGNGVKLEHQDAQLLKLRDPDGNLIEIVKG